MLLIRILTRYLITILYTFSIRVLIGNRITILNALKLISLHNLFPSHRSWHLNYHRKNDDCPIVVLLVLPLLVLAPCCSKN